MDFGRWLRVEIKTRGWTLADFADRLGVTPTTASRWANGSRTPDYATCERIASVLEVDPDMVLTSAGHRASPNRRHRELAAQMLRLRAEQEQLHRQLHRNRQEMSAVRREIFRQDLASQSPDSLAHRVIVALDDIGMPATLRSRVESRIFEALGAAPAPQPHVEEYAGAHFNRIDRDTESNTGDPPEAP